MTILPLSDEDCANRNYGGDIVLYDKNDIHRDTVFTKVDLPFRLLYQCPAETSTPHLFIADKETGYEEIGCFKLTRKIPKAIKDLKSYNKVGKRKGLNNITDEQKEMIIKWAWEKEIECGSHFCTNWWGTRQFCITLRCAGHYLFGRLIRIIYKKNKKGKIVFDHFSDIRKEY